MFTACTDVYVYFGYLVTYKTSRRQTLKRNEESYATDYLQVILHTSKQKRKPCM